MRVTGDDNTAPRKRYLLRQKGRGFPSMQESERPAYLFFRVLGTLFLLLLANKGLNTNLVEQY